MERNDSGNRPASNRAGQAAFIARAAAEPSIATLDNSAALEVYRRLGVGDPIAWSAKHTRMQLMAEREAGRTLQGEAVIEDACLGGERRGTAGRGSEHKVDFVAAVQLIADDHPAVARSDPVTDFAKAAISHRTERYLVTAARVRSDGLNSLPGVEQTGAVDVPEVVGAGRCRTGRPCFTWINTLLGNVKNAPAEVLTRTEFGCGILQPDGTPLVAQSVSVRIR